MNKRDIKIIDQICEWHDDNPGYDSYRDALAEFIDDLAEEQKTTTDLILAQLTPALADEVRMVLAEPDSPFSIEDMKTIDMMVADFGQQRRDRDDTENEY